MDNREEVLGFVPQKETPYNKLLPYGGRLDVESREQVAQIKAWLGRTVQLRDIKIGASHWTGQLSKYIRLFGHKFSKEDHLAFIWVLYELTTIPGLEYSLVQKFATLLITLLKKRDLLNREDLVLPWKPLYKLVENMAYSPYEHHGLVLYPSNIEIVLKSLVRMCRVYFSTESTQEMLDEWRPLMCPFDVTMMKAMFYFELFLPTHIPPEHHDKGFRLWLEEFIGIWDTCQNSPRWEGNLVNLFARLANDNIGYINWEPYIPKILTRLLRSFNLPVGTNKILVGKFANCYDIVSVTTWLAAILGGGSSAQDHIGKLFKALESFYHPSNFGKWNTKLMRLMFKLPKAVVRRVQREREPEVKWELPIPDHNKLSDDDITKFVLSMKPIVFLAMFSKIGSHDSAAAIDQLAQLRPEIIIPPLLEHTYPALETLTEPHRLIASLNCTMTVARSMLNSQRWYPEGRTHVLPLLNLSLPGIDPNDIKKCLTTFQLISTLASLVPIVDCSQAINMRDDLTEIEKEVCSASSQFEDFVLLFMDRVFALIENSAQEHTRTDSMASDRLNHEETMLEVGLLSTFNAIMQQSSSSIYQEALRKLFRFVSTSVFEIRVAGRFASDLCRAAAKVHPEMALKLFVSHFCGTLKSRVLNEDLTKEEHLDNEFLWNLKLLSETVRSDGRCLLPYKEDLIAVLSATLHLKCKDGADLAGNLLRHVLKALTLTYACDYRSTAQGWDKPLDQHLPIRDWGKPGDLDDLQLKWHIPTPEEKAFATTLLERFLCPELDRISGHIAGQEMIREDLCQSLAIIVHCIIGAGNALLMWQSEPESLVDSLVELTRFNNTASSDDEDITIRGCNVRELIAATIRPLLDHLLGKSEDDTKSLLQLIRVYNSLLFYHGTQKEDFDGRWKSLHIVKKSMENVFLGKKKHIRAVLVDRVQLQHELRIINRKAKVFTTLHRDLFTDLFRLSISRYGEVRKSAQSVLGHGFHLYAYSYRSLLDKVLDCLKESEDIPHYQFKGALYVVEGEHKRSLVTKRNWEVMNQVWLAVVQAQHSEKPSILRLIDDITDKLHKNIETTEISIKAHDELIVAAGRLWQSGKPPTSEPQPSVNELQHSQDQEVERNDSSLRAYHKLVDNLVKLIDGGSLRWKFHQLAFQMLSLLVRYDVPLPAPAVSIFVRNLVNDQLMIRKISIGTVAAILKLQKRPHKRVPVDPYKCSGTDRPTLPNEVHPGDRADNLWHHYNGKDLPDTEEKWLSCTFIEKTHWGYYCWPKVMYQYAPVNEQPKLGRLPEEMSPEERAIYDYFSNSDFIEKLFKFMSLEGQKGKDKFHSKYFTLFKGLFRNFDDAFVPVIKVHLQRLVADTRHDSHECNQRLAAEIMSGLIRGAKHWSWPKVSALWLWLVPVLRTAIGNITVESIADWGTCFATAAESRDPRKLVPMLELLMEQPLRGEGGSFGDASRLYILQGALAQQEWRVPELLQRLVAYLGLHLSHSYKNVRDRIGSVLVNVLLYDIPLPHGQTTLSPRTQDLVHQVLPQLDILRSSTDNNSSAPEAKANMVSSGAAVDAVEIDDNGSAHLDALSIGDVEMGIMDVELPSAGDVKNEDTSNHTMRKVMEAGTRLLSKNLNLSLNGESEERKTAIRICKSVMKWLQGGFSRMLNTTHKDIFQFIPILCMLESENKDDELRYDAIMTLACMAQALLAPDIIPDILETINEVLKSKSWHARASILGYSQVMVFCNLFLMQEPATVTHIQELTISLLCDEQVEVREMAAVTLGGFLHCGYMTVTKDMMVRFESLSSTKIKTRKKGEKGVLNPERMVQRHAGVLGLSACVLAFPYDVPEFVPQILMDLSDHLGDAQLIQVTVKKTLSNFRRTHHDNWQDHKQKFTDDQLVVLTDLLVSPNYYA